LIEWLHWFQTINPSTYYSLNSYISCILKDDKVFNKLGIVFQRTAYSIGGKTDNEYIFGKSCSKYLSGSQTRKALEKTYLRRDRL
jgi:hypothetical protein